MNSRSTIFIAILTAGFFSATALTADESQKFEDPREAIRFIITTLQSLKEPVEVTKFKHLFDPKYFEDPDPRSIIGTEPRAIDWKLPKLPKGKILWVATDGDGDIAMAAIQTAEGIDVFSFALVEIRTGTKWKWVIRPPGKQDPFEQILRPWHNQRTIKAKQQ